MITDVAFNRLLGKRYVYSITVNKSEHRDDIRVSLLVSFRLGLVFTRT